jgi:hypothetical protein
MPGRTGYQIPGTKGFRQAMAQAGAEILNANSVSISAAAGSANVSLVTFQAKDANGNNVTSPVNLDVLLSDATTGAGLTATTASGAVAAGASGIDLVTLVTKKALRVQTDATGKYILSITDTSKTLFYPCAYLDGKRLWAPVLQQAVTARTEVSSCPDWQIFAAIVYP